MSPTSIIPKALRLRATLADSLGEHEAARLLRGYADALSQDPGSIARIRERITESAAMFGEAPGTPIVQVWRDALADLTKGPPAKGGPAPAPAPGVAPAVVAALRSELAEQGKTVASLVARIAALEAAAVPAAPPVPLSAPLEKLRALRMPDGRTWLALVESIAAEHGVTVDDLASHRKQDTVVAARFHAWWYLHRKAGANYSTPYIGEAFGMGHTTVLRGIQRHAERLTAPPAPPSGPRLRDFRAPGKAAAR